jgi:hypothetical protein
MVTPLWPAIKCLGDVKRRRHSSSDDQGTMGHSVVVISRTAKEHDA